MPTSRLVERDVAMLASIGRAGVLTATALEWLHWPTWEARYRTWRATRPDLPTALYRPTTRVYDRLRGVAARGLITRIPRVAESGPLLGRRITDALLLTEQGVAALRQADRWDEARMSLVRVRDQRTTIMQHGVAVGDTYAALATRLAARPGRALADWQIDRHLFARGSYDRIPVLLPTAGGGQQAVDTAIVPDATGVLHSDRGGIRVFVEVDRGRPAVTWAHKVRAYQAYQGSAALRERYGVSGFLLLCLTTTERQRARLMETTARVLGQASDRYLFGLIDDIHPTTIGDCWQKLGVVERARSQVLAGRVVERYAVTPAPHVLIQ